MKSTYEIYKILINSYISYQHTILLIPVASTIIIDTLYISIFRCETRLEISENILGT